MRTKKEKPEESNISFPSSPGKLNFFTITYINLFFHTTPYDEQPEFLPYPQTFADTTFWLGPNLFSLKIKKKLRTLLSAMQSLWAILLRYVKRDNLVDYRIFLRKIVSDWFKRKLYLLMGVASGCLHYIFLIIWQHVKLIC